MPHREVLWMLGIAASQASSFSLLLYSLQPPLAQAPVATYSLWLDNQRVRGNLMREMWRTQFMRFLSVASVQHKKKTIHHHHCSIYIVFTSNRTSHLHSLSCKHTHIYIYICLAQMWHIIHHVSIRTKFDLKNLYFHTFNLFTNFNIGTTSYT
jgi:hypothetical protein